MHGVEVTCAIAVDQHCNQARSPRVLWAASQLEAEAEAEVWHVLVAYRIHWKSAAALSKRDCGRAVPWHPRGAHAEIARQDFSNQRTQEWQAATVTVAVAAWP